MKRRADTRMGRYTDEEMVMTTPLWPVLRIAPIRHDWEVDRDMWHGARADGTAHGRRREDADPTCLALGWRRGVMTQGETWRPITQPPLGPDGTPLILPLAELPTVCRLDLAIADRLAAKGAIVRGAQPKAVAFIIGISSAWLAEGGAGLHDPSNPRLRQLWDTTTGWVESFCGPGAVVMARADLDEMGGGIIDIWAVPVFYMSIGRNKKDGSRPAPRPVVAVSFAFDLLNEKYEYHRAEKYKGAQEDWYRYLRDTLEPRVQRGLPAKVTRRKNLPPGEWAKYIEDQKQQAAEAEAWATLAAEELADAVAQRDDTLAKLDALEARYAALMAAAKTARTESAEAEAVLAALVEQHTHTLDRIQADYIYAGRIQDAARTIRDAAQAIQDARDTLPDALLELIEDPHIEDTLARISGVEIPDRPEPAPEQQRRRKREDEGDEPGRPG